MFDGDSTVENMATNLASYKYADRARYNEHDRKEVFRLQPGGANITLAWAGSGRAAWVARKQHKRARWKPNCGSACDAVVYNAQGLHWLHKFVAGAGPAWAVREGTTANATARAYLLGGAPAGAVTKMIAHVIRTSRTPIAHWM